MKKRILYSILMILILLQFIQIDKSPIPIESSETFANQMNPPDEILAALKIACYDCHSNETKYPWYTYVAPVSFWIRGHIKNGRNALNFSTWNNLNEKDKKHALHECGEMIEDNHMPPKGYVRMHKKAHWNESLKNTIIKWFNKNS
ncbi:MAG: heme-binding domain-containing protein [Saprospiraceae bacterium]|nr:heme-binding domain-containing protein [Saprospiraceae bacterium]